MRKHLKLALMAMTAIPTIATSLTLTPLLCPAQAWAQAHGKLPNRIVAVRDGDGSIVYVNTPVASSPIPHHGTQTKQIREVQAGGISAPDTAGRSDVESAIADASARHGMDPALVRAVVRAESNFNPLAVSRKGALGLMQLMPATAGDLNVTNPFDPRQNVDAGVRHLKQLLANFGGDLQLGLAAYNAGEAAVRRSGGVPNFAETRDYVRQIVATYSGDSSVGNGRVQASGKSGHPASARIFRDEHGVLTMTNTE